MQDLCGCELKDNRIQCLVPAKKNAGNTEDDNIQSQYHIECIHIVFLRKENGDEVCSSCGCMETQAQGNDKAIDDTTEYRDQKQIISDG